MSTQKLAKKQSQSPWYRQFWPWFIIALPATSVVVGLTFAFISFRHADTLVRDNYYKDGLAINAVLDQDRRAAELGISARIDFDVVSGEVVIQLDGAGQAPQTLTLMLLHPVDQSRDSELVLTATGDGRYRGDLKIIPTNRYYLQLFPENNPGWRLNGELDFVQAQQILLMPNV